MKTDDLLTFINKFDLKEKSDEIELHDTDISFINEKDGLHETEYILYQSGRWEVTTFIDRNDGTGDIDEVVLANGYIKDLKEEQNVN